VTAAPRRSRLDRAVFFALGAIVAFAISKQTAAPHDDASRHRSSSAEVTGIARVIDGDTIDVGGVRVRLFGIDAPERDQSCSRSDGTRYACGRFASGFLADAIGRAAIRCTRRDVDRYGRMVGVCTNERGDVARMSVAGGAAMAYRHFSLDYVADEEAARKRGAGIWQGAFDAPWDYRHKGDTGKPMRKPTR
jgi:endonuclease YncB( thermonuclease family)